MTNQLFDRRRFKVYLRKLWAEQRAFALTFTLILVGLIAVVEVFVSLLSYPSIYNTIDTASSYDPAGYAIMFFSSLLLYCGGCVAGSRMFDDGQQKAGRIHVLTTPVTMFESWLARVLIFVVGYLFIFHAAFFVLDGLRVVVFSSALPQAGISMQWWFNWEDLSGMLLPARTYPLIGYAFCVSCYALGCFVFPRRPFLSTTICLFCIGLVLIFLMVFIAFKERFFFEIFVVWAAILAICNFWLSYKRLCELEIIDRM